MEKSIDTAIDDFATALRLLVRRLRAEAPSDLSWTQSAVLSRLATDGPTTTANLARAENMKPQSMGAAVAALEEAGLVERCPHPTDGRQVHIVLSARGAALRAQTRAAKRGWLAAAVARLDQRERETLFAAAAIIRRLGEMDTLP